MRDKTRTVEPADRESVLEQIKKLIERGTSRDHVLDAVCHLLAEKFPRYDWVGFYLVDPKEEGLLVLGPFVGEPTEHVRIPFGRGICGQVAESKRTLVVPDVTKEANYLACSLKVRSEIVVPVFRGGEFVGELDIDSHTPNAFSESDREMLENVCALVSQTF